MNKLSIGCCISGMDVRRETQHGCSIRKFCNAADA